MDPYKGLRKKELLWRSFLLRKKRKWVEWVDLTYFVDIQGKCVIGKA